MVHFPQPCFTKRNRLNLNFYLEELPYKGLGLFAMGCLILTQMEDGHRIRGQQEPDLLAYSGVRRTRLGRAAA